MAPPPTAQTAGPIGLIFSLRVHQRHRIGVTVAIFEFPSQTLKNGSPYGLGPASPETQKMAKNFFSNFSFFPIGMCKGMFEFIQKHFLRQDLSFFFVIFVRFGEHGTFSNPKNIPQNVNKC